MGEIIKSALIHLAVAVVAQTAVGLATGNWLAGAALGGGYFLGREVAQRQYRIAGWVMGSSGRSIKALKPWEGFDIPRWSVDELLDLFLPLVGVLAVAAIAAR